MDKKYPYDNPIDEIYHKECERFFEFIETEWENYYSQEKKIGMKESEIKWNFKRTLDIENSVLLKNSGGNLSDAKTILWKIFRYSKYDFNKVSNEIKNSRIKKETRILNTQNFEDGIIYKLVNKVSPFDREGKYEEEKEIASYSDEELAIWLAELTANQAFLEILINGNEILDELNLEMSQARAYSILFEGKKINEENDRARKNLSGFNTTRTVLLALLMFELSERDEIDASRALTYPKDLGLNHVAHFIHLIQQITLPKDEKEPKTWNESYIYQSIKRTISKGNRIIKDYEFLLKELEHIPFKTESFFGQLKELIKQKKEFLEKRIR